MTLAVAVVTPNYWPHALCVLQPSLLSFQAVHTFLPVPNKYLKNTVCILGGMCLKFFLLKERLVTNV